MNRAARDLCLLANAVLGAASAALADEAPMHGDPQHGAVVYQICQACHSLDEDDVGPRHRGVVGRRAGSVPGYPYSQALRASGVVFTPEVLDRWLANPQSVAPGTKMYFALKDARDRADVIAWLDAQR